MDLTLVDLLDKFKLNGSIMAVSTGRNWLKGTGAKIESFSPVDGRLIGSVMSADFEQYDIVVRAASKAYREWRLWPAPKRGEIVRQMGEAFRAQKFELAKLVSYEMGKNLQEGLGEVQEMIDICDFAVGISRQLHGLTMHSERPGHRMYEQYHPLGLVGIISAFNFPVAVWSWNCVLGWVCGDVCIWKPSEKTPLSAIACQNIISEVLIRNNVPEGVSCLVVGGRDVGEWISGDHRVSLVSATGSTAMGKAVGTAVAKRFGRSLLELGGNNAVIITKHADLDMAVMASMFGAVGTAGQRCTTTRRLLVEEPVYDVVKEKLAKAYKRLRIGNPFDEENHVGPLIDRLAVDLYQATIKGCKEEGGNFVVEGEILNGVGFESGCYVKPCIAEVKRNFSVVKNEAFVPILYLMKFQTLREAIEIQNDVPQGLSSSIMTLNLREAELFLSHMGSDCGIANVNAGTSGAEIGGAFGGEKETGGGRESGSDAWKAYMRRQTNTINYSSNLPMAQGIKFELELRDAT